MFLKYPREVRSINYSNIHNNSKISVIKKSTSDNSKKYVITPYLTKSDIAHRTEIYTPFARFKILFMNNRIYLVCEKRKSDTNDLSMDNKLYDSTSCTFVSNNLDFEIQNLLSVLCIINQFKEASININMQ